MRGRNGVLMSQLYRDWLKAEQKSYEILDQLKDDYNNPKYLTAAQAADDLLQELIQSPTLTASGILTKLRITAGLQRPPTMMPA